MSGTVDTGLVEFQPLDDATRSRLDRCGAATLANAVLKRGIRKAFLLGLAAVRDGQPKLIGPAWTVRFIPAREDKDSMALYARDDSMHRRAIEECPTGAVMVMDTRGDTTASCMGDMMALRLKVRGVAGVVTDGGFRDTPGIVDTGLPCFQHAPSGPATPLALSPVAFNQPVGCAGVAIYPNDVIVGDGEGVVVIPRHLVEEVAVECEGTVDYERFVAMHIKRGRSIYGLFPATPDSMTEYHAWVADGRPGLE